MEYFAVRVGWLYQPPSDSMDVSFSPRLIEDGLVVWHTSKFDYVGRYDADRVPRGTTLYHYPKAILLPPFMNGHTHIAETLIRGLVEDAPLQTWLYDHVWKVEPQMEADDATVATQLAVAELVSSGTIGIVDQFYYSEQIAQVLAETGMKGILNPSIFPDNPETGTAENAFQKNKDIFDKWHEFDGRIKVGVGPHALYTVDHDLFQEIGQFARDNDTWIHTHVSETHTEVENAQKEWQVSPVEKLAEMDLLDITLAAHCVHLSGNDLDLLQQHDTTILHNVSSNLKIGSGIANIPEMVNRGINIVLGTDGNASNNNLFVLEEMRTTAMLHKGLHHDPKVLSTEKVIQMATTNFHQIFGTTYSGVLDVGQPVDFTIFSLDSPAGVPVIDPVSNLVYSLSSDDCVMTVSDGKILYKDSHFPLLDIEQVKHDVQEATDRMIASADYSLQNNRYL